ncbi:MAG TPA: helix-turn-helix transcriptional regulator [Dissulfurispiraceae bacterium]|jgi:transcriptional regulator with XRE-family HTH domain|nr:helix-turn-helix transcriptional regulator [Dissulfurispiraceae bacterium]
MDIGKRIKELRESTGFSINQLARQSGIGQSTLSYVEMGAKNPTVETLLLICRGLGITPVEFFKEQEPELPSDLRQLLREAESLTSPQREKLAEFIKSLKRS